MKTYRITLRTRANDTPGTLYTTARELTMEVADRMSARAVLEAAATSMGLHLDPDSFSRTRSSRYAIADVAGSAGLSHITLNRDMGPIRIPGRAS